MQVHSPDYEKAEIELTVATISNYNQGCLLLFLDSGFAVTAPHGDANRITADSSGALHINLLGKKRKKKNPLPALFLTWCSSHKPKARRLKFTFADCEPPIIVHCDPKIPPSSDAVCSLVYCWPGQSQLVPLTWTRGQKLLLCQFGHHYS